MSDIQIQFRLLELDQHSSRGATRMKIRDDDLALVCPFGHSLAHFIVSTEATAAAEALTGPPGRNLLGCKR